jgi:hypothetical protein
MVDIRKDTHVTSYELRITDPYGETIKTTDEFTALDYARKVNEIGELSLSIEDKGEKAIYVPENRIEVWRSKGLSSRLDMNAVWFIYSVRNGKNLNGSNTFEIEAHDQIGLLDRRIVPYNEGNPTTQKQGPADDVIKAIMRENFGALATDTDRDLSAYLTIQGDSSTAPQVTRFFAKENVYDIIKEIADTSYENGTFLAFDIIYNPNSGTFEFRTYFGQRGIDRSILLDARALIFGLEYGSLDSITLQSDRGDERNYIYAGAKDVVGIVPPQTAIDIASIGLSPFHRKEFFQNASNSDDATELQLEADAALEEHRFKRTFEAELTQEFAVEKYGEKFDFGDKVSVSFDGNVYTAFVNAISVSVNNNGEKIEATLEGTADA